MEEALGCSISSFQCCKYSYHGRLQATNCEVNQHPNLLQFNNQLSWAGRSWLNPWREGSGPAWPAPVRIFSFHLAPLHFNCTGLLPVLLWPPLSFEPEDHVTNCLLDISPLKSLIKTTNCICVLTSLLRPQIGVTLTFSSPLMYTTQNSADTVIALLRNLHQSPIFQRKTSRRSVFQRKLNRIQKLYSLAPTYLPSIISQYHPMMG